MHFLTESTVWSLFQSLIRYYSFMKLHLNTGANTNLVCVDIFFCKRCVFMITLCVGVLLVSKGVRASSDLGE